MFCGRRESIAGSGKSYLPILTPYSDRVVPDLYSYKNVDSCAWFAENFIIHPFRLTWQPKCKYQSTFPFSFLLIFFQCSDRPLRLHGRSFVLQYKRPSPFSLIEFIKRHLRN